VLVQAIDKTTAIVSEFARLVEVVAAMNAADAAREIYKSFGTLLEHYRPPPGFSGSWQSTNEDFYKFMGYELFVTFMSFLVHENRWDLIADLLEEGLYVENTGTGNSGIVSAGQLSYGAELLVRRKNRLKLDRVSLQAAMLNERHTQSEIVELVPMRQFVDADYFLYLRLDSDWTAWSTLYISRQVPRYLAEAIQAKNAQRLFRPLKVQDIESLRKLLIERRNSLPQLFRHSFGFRPLQGFNPGLIGSQ